MSLVVVVTVMFVVIHAFVYAARRACHPPSVPPFFAFNNKFIYYSIEILLH